LLVTRLLILLVGLNVANVATISCKRIVAVPLGIVRLVGLYRSGIIDVWGLGIGLSGSIGSASSWIWLLRAIALVIVRSVGVGATDIAAIGLRIFIDAAIVPAAPAMTVLVHVTSKSTGRTILVVFFEIIVPLLDGLEKLFALLLSTCNLLGNG
jgi:hypothetical protein